MRRRDTVGAAILLLVVVLALVLGTAERGGGRGPSGSAGLDGPVRVSRLAATNRGADGVYRLPRFDGKAHRSAHPVEKGRPLRFAEATEVMVTPESHGKWEVDGDRAIWKLMVEAPGSLNLNFGFTRFALPESASLEFRSREGELLVRPFTGLDNDEHGELWTPVMAVEEVEVLLSVAQKDRVDAELTLGAINRGFREVSFAAQNRKIGDVGTTGNCYIDVVCSADDSGVGAIIDAYRDQIRAAAVYTLSGIDTCSGAAINNTRNDGTPLFVTAHHCGVRGSNVASMVVYWNHENRSCRAPGSAGNSGNGNGPITDFNSGAIFRATHAASDATIVEMDDALNPDHRVFLAGWSRTGTPRSGVTVHHPNISEKRISFDFDPVQSTDDSSTSIDPNGTHWRVVDWEFGSTEGGSSGSPLFDQNGRMVGQLSGGDAACGNDLSDWYGKLSLAWGGGGTSASRLSSWLDPDGTGVQELDGLDSAGVRVTIGDAEAEEGDSGSTELIFDVSLSEAADQVIELTYSTQDGAAQAGQDFGSVTEGQLRFEVGETSKEIAVLINGDTEPEENESFEVILSLQAAVGVSIGKREGIGTIRNDDFIEPVIESPVEVGGSTSEEIATRVVTRNTPTSFSLSGEPAGMTIDETGLIRWVPTEAGSVTVTVTASNPAGSDAQAITFTISANPLALAVESPPGLLIRTGGETNWIRRTGSAIAEGDFAQSGTLADTQVSWLEVEVEGPDYLGYWWKVSSEAEFDFLHLEVDGERRRSISGLLDWEYQVVAIGSGRHVVRWSYAKDESISEGLDRGFVDSVQLASGSTPFLMESSRVRLVAGNSIDYKFPTYRPGASFRADPLPAGIELSKEGELSGRLLSAGTHRVDLEVEQEGSQRSVPIVIEAIETTLLGAAVEQSRLPWVVSGEGTWIVSSESRAGGNSVRESGLGDDGSAVLATYVSGPGQLSFWWKVSSEADFDVFFFELDGVTLGSISGEVDWANVTVDLGYGQHVLKWTYSKDESISEGQDRAWLDGVSLSGYARWIMDQGVGGRTNVIFDPDRDGQNQLFEYATGGRATEWDRMPAVELVDGGLEWEVGKAPGLLGVEFDAEVSGDLLEWSNIERSVLRDDAFIFRVRDTIGVEEAEERFIRGTVHPVR